MKKQVLWRSMLGLRAAAALLMIGGFLATGARAASAQGEDSTIDENTYTGFNFDWSIEWDEDIWVEPSDDNTGGSDFLSLTSADDQPLALVTIFGIEAFSGDPDECATGYADELLSGRDNIEDVAEAEDLDLPRVPRDQANAAYTYTLTTASGDVDAVDYVECQTLVEDEAVILAAVTTTPDDFDGAVEIFQDLLGDIEVGGGSSADNGDEDVTPESEDEEVTPEDEEAEPTRDILLGGDEDEDVTPESDESDEDVTPESDEDNGTSSADSGIDGNTYESPTYGFTVEWDDSVWTPDEDRELVDNGDDGLDRLLIEHEEDGSLFSDLYVEAKEAYEGDPRDCVSGESDLLSSEDGVTDFNPLEGDNGRAVRGTSDAGGRFAAFTLTIDNGEDDPFDLVEHVECQTLEDGVSVVVFTLVTSPDGYEDELALAQEVIDSLELP